MKNTLFTKGNGTDLITTGPDYGKAFLELVFALENIVLYNKQSSFSNPTQLLNIPSHPLFWYTYMIYIGSNIFPQWKIYCKMKLDDIDTLFLIPNIYPLIILCYKVVKCTCVCLCLVRACKRLERTYLVCIYYKR